MKSKRLWIWFLVAATVFSLSSVNAGSAVFAADSERDSEASASFEVLFNDADTISKWAYEAIGRAAGHGFVAGSDGKFNPKAYVTRAEFARLLAVVLKLEAKPLAAGVLTDVAPKNWHYPYVSAVHHAGFMSGYNGLFQPNESITREQMASTLVRALGIPAGKPTGTIRDLNEAAGWARETIETAAASGIMVGENGGFQPKAKVTREMAAVLAMRAYDYKSVNAPAEPGGPETAIIDAVKRQLASTASFVQNAVKNPEVSSVGGDWTVLALARSGIEVPQAYYEKYYANVEATLKEKEGKLHNVKYTEYDRVILALTAIGKNIGNVAGYNLAEPLADFDTLIKQGINGPIFALIALDSKEYDIPLVAGVKTQTTRDMLVDFILKRELAGGGWALGASPTQADPDITAMALQSLTPYYGTNQEVKAAADRAVAWLGKAQQKEGGFATGAAATSESISQVVVALTGLGIDPHTDARFVKNGKSAMQALLDFAAAGGGFTHIKSGGTDNGGAKPGEVDLMATDQALYALAAYKRFIEKQTRLYDMRDVA